MVVVRTRFFQLVTLAAIVAMAGSCSLYKDYQASRPANVMKIETRLEQSGFHRVPIATPEQNGAVEQLPLHRLNRYQSADGSVFWYADPTVCSCLYEGDQKAYDTYVGILEQEHDTAEYMNDSEPEQVAYLSSFGYAFPPPVLFGRWPVLRSSGGPIHSGGGHGGGIHGVGHGGGGNGGVHGRH
jgi:hypothetical protein